MYIASTTTVKNPIAIAVIIAVFVVIIVVIIVLAIKRREEVFEGEVIDKNIVESTTNNMPMNGTNGGINIINSGGVRHEYKIKVKTASGKTINYTISSGMYDVVKIGDRVSKPKGTTEITILSSKGASNTPAASAKPTDGSTNSNSPTTFV